MAVPVQAGARGRATPGGGDGPRGPGTAASFAGTAAGPSTPTPPSLPMSYAAYKALHYLGIFLLVATLAAALARRAHMEGEDPWRKRLGMVHGTALLLVLLGGFGMLARLGTGGGPFLSGWVLAKLGIWALLGATLVGARRSAALAGRFLWVVPLLAAAAGLLAFTKPF